MRRRPPAERFWEKVDKTAAGCWLWTAACDRLGYGHFAIEHDCHVKSHRYSLELSGVVVAAGMFVCHRCDNPPCVNPDHLFLGTATDNERDKMAKGRRRNVGSVGIANPRAKLNEETVRAIRAARSEGACFYDLARRFGVSPVVARRVALRLSWKHVI